MKNTLIIHIGMPKTGSTAIQNFLCNNKEVLERYGWCYPCIGENANLGLKHHLHINGFKLFLSACPTRDFKNTEWKECVKEIQDSLEKSNAILSFEGLFGEGLQENIIRELKREFQNVKIICYLRRQDLYIESYWNQLVKNLGEDYGKVSETCENFYRKVMECAKTDEGRKSLDSVNARGVLDTDYYKYITNLSGVVGKENLILRVYERQQFKGIRKDVLSDFLDALQLPEDEFDYNVSVKDANKRIDGIYLELKLLLNEQWGKTTKTDSYLSEKLQQFTEQNEIKKWGYLHANTRKEILDACAIGNRQLAKEYFGRDKLFLDENIDSPYYEGVFDDKEKEIIRTFAVITAKQDEMISELQKKVTSLTEYTKILAENNLRICSNGRKLVYFGAGNKGKKCLEELSFETDYIIDNDEAKSGTCLSGVSIKPAKSIDKWTDLFVVVTLWDSKEVERQLEELGLVKNKDFVCAKEYFPCLYLD